MGLGISISLKELSSETTLRFDYNYLKYQKENILDTSIDRYFSKHVNDLTNFPEELIYVEIGDVDKVGNVDAEYIDINVPTLENEDKIKKINDANIQDVKLNNILISSVRPNLKKIVLIDDAKINYYFTKAFIQIKPKINSKILYYFLTKFYFERLNSVARMGKGYPTLKIEDLLQSKINGVVANNLLKHEKEIISEIIPLEKEIQQNTNLLKSEEEIINKYFEKYYNYNFDKIYNSFFSKSYQSNLKKLIDNPDIRFSFKYLNPLRDELINQLNKFCNHSINSYLEIPIILGKTIKEESYDVAGDSFYFSMATIKSYKFDYENSDKVSDEYWEKYKGDFSLNKNDILLARSGEGTIGKTAIKVDEKKGIFADFTMRIRLKDYDAEFAYYFFRTKIFQELINLTKKGLGNNTNIYPYEIGLFLLPDKNKKMENCKNEIKGELLDNLKKHEIIRKNQDKIKSIFSKYI